MKIINGAIFDMDGLLFDSEKVFDMAWQETADNHNFELNHNMQTELRGTSGKTMETIIKKYVPNEDPETLVKELFDNAYIILQKHVPMKKGVKEILDYFKKCDVKMAVASSSPKYMIENNLNVSGISGYFDAIVCGKDVKFSKPNPDIFLLAAKQINCNPSECFVFEDAIAGVAAGCAADCLTIMVPDMVKPSKKEYDIAFGIYDDLYQAMINIQKMCDDKLIAYSRSL